MEQTCAPACGAGGTKYHRAKRQGRAWLRGHFPYNEFTVYILEYELYHSESPNASRLRPASGRASGRASSVRAGACGVCCCGSMPGPERLHITKFSVELHIRVMCQVSNQVLAVDTVKHFMSQCECESRVATLMLCTVPGMATEGSGGGIVRPSIREPSPRQHWHTPHRPDPHAGHEA